ncbi:Retrovirus-related Pol polyprotein from transposon opus [Dictyocoela muelleri]|nr:Retrovirus-related Pol polyprotein from transposon opus [Dictyocoela muelleri]
MQFTRMPQGYKYSISIFQRGMGIILESMIGKNCLVYIDDIIIFGKDLNKHQENLKMVEDRIKIFGLVINNEKSVYAKKESEFLGYKIGFINYTDNYLIRWNH